MSYSAPDFNTSSSRKREASIPLLSSFRFPSNPVTDTENWKRYYVSGDQLLAMGELTEARSSYAAALEAAEVCFETDDFNRLITVRKLAVVHTRLGDSDRASSVVEEASNTLSRSPFQGHPARLLLDVARNDNARLRGDSSEQSLSAEFLYQKLTSEISSGGSVESPYFEEFFIPAAQCVFDDLLEFQSRERTNKFLAELQKTQETLFPGLNVGAGAVGLMHARHDIAQSEVTPSTLASIYDALNSLGYSKGRYAFEIYQAHVCALLAHLELRDIKAAQEHLRCAHSVFSQGQIEKLSPLHRTFLLKAEESFARSIGRLHYAAHVLREHVELLGRYAPSAVHEREEMLKSLESTHHYLGNSSEVDRTQKELLNLAHSSLGEGSRAFAEALWSRAVFQMSQGAPESASKLLIWAWEIAQGMSDVCPELSVRVSLTLAKATSIVGKPAEALYLIDRVTHSPEIEVESYRHLNRMGELFRARALIKLGRREEAATCLEVLLKEIPGIPDDWHGQEAIRVLAALKIHNGEYEKAERLLLPFRTHEAADESINQLLLAASLMAQGDSYKFEDGAVIAKRWIAESNDPIAKEFRSLAPKIAILILPRLLSKSQPQSSNMLLRWLYGG